MWLFVTPEPALVWGAEPALLDCLVNREQVAACMARPGQRFRSAGDAKEAAAVEIQASFRCLRAQMRLAAARAASVVLQRELYVRTIDRRS